VGPVLDCCTANLRSQRWRVTEISHIILVLLDSRAPLLHYPPSLVEYLSDRRVILVLTKVDISGAARADAWTRYFNAHYPGLRVVQVESYLEKEASAVHQVPDLQTIGTNEHLHFTGT
jgi:ribosome biogenesis GTPase A